jgi:predicted DNA-binding transcriptional regulator YafY
VVRADRLVSLVLLLQARGRMTVTDLAAELEVSMRTVYRDLEALSAGGVPVLTTPGPGGGCELLDGYRFPLRGLRPEEAQALLVLGVPAALSELGLERAATAAHRQIRVTAGLASDAPQASALVHLDMPRWFRAGEQVPQLATLAQALRRQRALDISYARGEDGARSRVVSPLGLVNKAGTWYLVAGTDSGRVTVFRAGRITQARELDRPAPRPAGFDLAGFWASWSADFAATRPRLPVRLRASPLALAAMPETLGENAQRALDAAAQPDAAGWRELTLEFEHERAAAHRLAGFGGEVEVIAPARVRDRLRQTARAILARYRQLGPGDQPQVRPDGRGRLVPTPVQDPLGALIGSAPGLSADTDLERLRDEWER